MPRISKTRPIAETDRLRAFVEPKSINEETREFDLMISSGRRARVSGWVDGEGFIVFEEELEISESAVNTERARAGTMPLIDSHGHASSLAGAADLDDTIGRVLETWVKDGKLWARCRFSFDPQHEGKWMNVVRGVITACSPRYSVEKYRDLTVKGAKTRHLRAVKWTIHEVSLLPIPAEPTARVRGEDAPAQEHYAEVELGEQPAGERLMEPDESAPNTPAGQTPATPAAPATPTNTRALNTPAAPVAPVAPAPPGVDPATIQAAVAAGIRAEQERQGNIRALQTSLRLTDDESVAAVNHLITNNVPFEQARGALLERRMTRDLATVGTSGFTVVGEERTKIRAAMSNALLARARCVADDGNPVVLTQAGRDFRGMSIMRMLEESLNASGVRTRGLTQDEMISRGMHSTSDFPLILMDVSNNTLRQAYQEKPSLWKLLGTRSDLADFKTKYVTQLGSAPDLEEQLEGGPLRYGTLAEAQENYKLRTYSKGIAFSRQLMINDDLDAFTRVTRGFGRAASRLEANLAWARITSNPTMADGNALFHANHANLTTGVMSITSLSAARALMRLQKDIDGTTPINIEPVYLAVPVELETLAKQLTTQTTPAQASEVNPFQGAFKGVIVEPRLSVASALQWYMFADQADAPLFEYAYLRGQEGVFIDQEIGFDVEGLKIKCRHDFGIGLIDYRGAVRSSGA